MKKQFLRVKQVADQTFGRAEKTEVLSEDLVSAEKQLDNIKTTATSISKRISTCLQSQGTDNQATDKRLRKYPEFMLGQAMKECSSSLGDKSVFGLVLSDCGNVEMDLGKELLEYETKLEHDVLDPFNKLLESDIPNVLKHKRTLAKLVLDMDSAKSRYQQSIRHSHPNTNGATKLESLKEEYEEAQNKVEQCRDNFATELLQVLSGEPQLAQNIINFVTLQKQYHQSALDRLESLVPSLEDILRNSSNGPVFGLPLEDHLYVTQREIAYPIEVCICCLLEAGLVEEGLLRIAGGASKIKKLKLAFDAGIIDWSNLGAEFRDPHVVSSVLKSYLRELPDPLLTHTNYTDWMNAARIADLDLQMSAYKDVISKLPMENYNNLKYLIKFLSTVAQNQEANKMTPQNIAIVMAPNLLWPPKTNDDNISAIGENMFAASAHSAIVERLVTHSEELFPGGLDFYVSVSPSEAPSPTHTINQHKRSSSSDSQWVFQSGSNDCHPTISNAHSNSSLSDQTSPIHSDSPKPTQRRKKPAPIPPVNRSESAPSDVVSINTSEVKRGDKPIVPDRPSPIKLQQTTRIGFEQFEPHLNNNHDDGDKISIQEVKGKFQKPGVPEKPACIKQSEGANEEKRGSLIIEVNKSSGDDGIKTEQNDRVIITEGSHDKRNGGRPPRPIIPTPKPRSSVPDHKVGHHSTDL